MSDDGGNGRSKTLPPFEVVDMEAEEEGTPVFDPEAPVLLKHCRQMHRSQSRLIAKAWDVATKLEGIAISFDAKLERLGERIGVIEKRDKDREDGRRAIYRQVAAGVVLLVVGGILSRFVFGK